MKPYFGPCRVGGTYYCGYWRLTYIVLAVNPDSITVRWADGRLSTHRTAWDWHRDTVISEPEPTHDALCDCNACLDDRAADAACL